MDGLEDAWTLGGFSLDGRAGALLFVAPRLETEDDSELNRDHVVTAWLQGGDPSWLRCCAARKEEGILQWSQAHELRTW